MNNSVCDNLVHRPLKSFLRERFGKNCYQASKAYMTWIDANILANFHLTQGASGKIISLIQSLSFKDNNFEIKSFFNFISDPKSAGSGLKQLAMIKREPRFFIPAVANEMLGTTYSSFGAIKLELLWLKKIVFPLPNHLWVQNLLSNHVYSENQEKDIIVTNRLDDEIISQISEISQISNTEFLKWRLQSRKNKRVFVALNKKESSFVIGVRGNRKGIPVFRIIVAKGETSSILKNLYEITSIAKKLGSIVLLVTVSSSVGRELTRKYRFKERSGISTYLKSDNSDYDSETLMLFGDLGFDEQWGGR